jgi:hypothetical protein
MKNHQQHALASIINHRYTSYVRLVRRTDGWVGGWVGHKFLFYTHPFPSPPRPPLCLPNRTTFTPHPAFFHKEQILRFRMIYFRTVAKKKKQKKKFPRKTILRTDNWPKEKLGNKHESNWSRNPEFCWLMRRKRRVLKFRLIFFSGSSSFHQVHRADLVHSLVSFLPWLRIRHLSCLILSVRWCLFFTLVVDSTFVLFDLVRSLVFFFYLGCRFDICLVWSRPFVGLFFFFNLGCGFYICLVWSRPSVGLSFFYHG